MENVTYGLFRNEKWRNRRKCCFFMIVLLALCSSINAQNKLLSGQVADESGEPLIGVSVLQKGTTNGTVTDFNGMYSLSVPTGSVISFSYIGYITKEVTVSNQEMINIILNEDTQKLDEVVVVGYGVQKKSSVTGAISQVKSEDMMNRTISRPEQALQGKTAGVQIIQTSGSPGSNPLVRVRGISSNASSDPLYVVDGLRTTNIGGIDPNDIETMEVLKDAASAAIYGAEAGNGVILITTKKGKKGFATISYDYQFTNQSLSRIPKVMNANEYINYMTEANYILKSDIEKKWDGVTDTDWTKIAFENSLMHKHNVAVQGANESGSFYASLSYLNNDGIVKGDADLYKRLSATINADYQIKPWLKIGTNNSIERYQRQNVSENSEYGSLLAAVLQLDPLTPDVYNADKLPAHMQTLVDNNYVLLQNKQGQYYALSAFQESEQVHPMIMRDKGWSKFEGFNIMGSAYGDLTPIKGLTITSRLGYIFSAADENTFGHDFYANSTAKQDYINVNAQTSNTMYYQWENFANYILTLDRHNLTAMGGMSFSKNRYNFTRGTVNDLLKDDPLFAYLNFATSEATRSLNGETTEMAKLSYFGRLSYDYDGKYMVQTSLRADAADKAFLPSDNRWGYFPAVSVGWMLSNEDFFSKDNNPVSYLKLRASWGQNGSIAGLGGYKWASTITSNAPYPFTNNISYNIGSYPNVLGNRDLKWETSEQLNFGVDTRLFNDRLTIGVDYFEKKTKDLIIPNIVPSLEVGNTASPVNAGNVSNKGFEFELGWKDNIGDLQYNIRGNIATLKNKVTYLDPSVTRIDGAKYHTYNGITAFEYGYPVWYFRGYTLDKIDQETGNPTFKDINDDGAINDDDKTMIGSAIPDFTYGITLSAAYKGFDLTVFGSGSQGNDIYNCITRTDRPNSNRLSVFYNERWTPENKTASRPKPGSNAEEMYWISDAVVFDGSYFKIKQIQLGYTLPKSLLRKISLGNVRLYASMDDWFTFTSYPGLDPEASAGTSESMGVDKGSYPSSKKLVFGINLTF